MSLKRRLEYPVPPGRLFDRFLDFYRREGFHVEEADRVEMRVRLEKESALGFLFGLGRRWILADFDPHPGGCLVKLTVRGGGEFAMDIEVALDQLAETISSEVAQAQRASAPRVENPQQIIIRELVRIPCPYCGSLVDNTLTQCPQCGGELRWS